MQVVLNGAQVGGRSILMVLEHLDVDRIVILIPHSLLAEVVVGNTDHHSHIIMIIIGLSLSLS